MANRFDSDRLTKKQRDLAELVRHKSKDRTQLDLLAALDAVAPRPLYSSSNVTPDAVPVSFPRASLPAAPKTPERKDSLASDEDVWPGPRGK